MQAVVANIGDAKAVLARSSTTSEGETVLKSIVLTREHKAIFPQERSRIQKVNYLLICKGQINLHMYFLRLIASILPWT